MAEYETEEQQVEAIKQFWKDNGTAIILGAVIGFGGLFGWNYYKDHKVKQTEAASNTYASAIASIQAGADEQPEFMVKAEQLKQDFSGSNYASLAALRLAQQYVTQNNLEKAAEQLAWVVDQDNSTFKAVAQLRLARVQLQQGQYSEAVTTAKAIQYDAYKVSGLLIQAEALLAQGDKDGAKALLIQAKEASGALVNNPLLAMRLAEFGIND